MLAFATSTAIFLRAPLSVNANYEYRWIPGGLVPQDLLEELSALYSEHYGIWGPSSERPFSKIRLSPDRIRKWLAPSESRLAYASLDGRVVGYANRSTAKSAELGCHILGNPTGRPRWTSTPRYRKTTAVFDLGILRSLRMGSRHCESLCGSCAS